MSTAPSFDVAGDVAFVTGAARGMGKAIAAGLALAGAKVTLADLDGAAAEAAADELRGAGAEALALAVDHTDAAGVSAAVEQTQDRLGPIGILVNNAGVLSGYDILEMTLADWDRVMAINLRGPLICMKAVLPGMVERRRGSVVSIGSSLSSRAAVMNFPAGGPDYCVSKAGIQALTRAAAQSMAPHGVRVNAIAPGVVDTPMHAENRDFVVDFGVRHIPLGRLQQPDEVTGAVVYLSSDAGQYVTGQTLHVNGGLLMVD